MKYYISLDQGSSSSRAVAFGVDGRLAFQSRRPLRCRHDGAIAEYDAAELARGQLDALDELLDLLPPESEIAGLAVASQRSTVVLWDRNTGAPLCPAPSWQDGRAAALLDEIPLDHGQIRAITGLYKTPYYSAPKILWCLRNYPAAAKAAREGTLAIGPVASYLVWLMTGGEVFATDPTLAQRTLLFDLRAWNWSEKLAAVFSVPPQSLPQIRPSAADYGVFRSKRGPIRILALAGDQQAAMAGAGALSADTALVNYGTGAFFLAHADGPAPQAAGLLESAGWESGRHLLEGTVNAASSSLDWLNRLGIEFSARDVDELCRRSENPALMLCSLGGLGSPYWDYSTPAAITNLGARTEKCDIVRGAVEGVAILTAQAALAARRAGAKFGKIIASGGFSRSDYLLEFQSGLLQLPVERAAQEETTALGAACLAARAQGEDVSGWFSPGKTFVPPFPQQRAGEILSRWESFYRAVRG